MSTPAVDVVLSFDARDMPEPFEIVSCRVAEGMSELTRAELEIACRDDPDFESALTKDAVVQILFDGMEQRRFTLKVERVAFLGVERASYRYRVDLQAHLGMLRLANNTRKFRDMSAKDIVTKVLDEHRVAHEWKTTRETRRRDYCVQYHETSLDFVLRLLEFEGIYYTFEDDGTLVLADKSSASPEVEGQRCFELLDSAGALQRGERGIFEIGRGGSIASGRVTVNDFNWKTPKKNLLQSAAADLDADLDAYDYPSGFREEREGVLLAELRLEALRAQTDRLVGKSDVPSFAPARAMTFGSSAGEVFAGEHVFTHVEHELLRPGFGDDALGYVNGFRAIRREVPFRPEVKTPRPEVAGFHTAMVRGPQGEEIHTDEHGRFRAQFHWDREATGTDQDSRWMRVLQESATSMGLARVGWEMSVGYIDGDPDRPVGLSRHINGEMVPNYEQPSNKSMMTIKTPTYPGKSGWNEWRMDDRAGSQSMDVRAERDLLNKVLNDRLEQVGHDVVHTCQAKLARSVKHDQTVSIGTNLKLSCDAGASLLVSGDREVSVGGGETIEVGQEQVSNIEKDEHEQVGGARMTVTGAFSMSLPPASDQVKGMPVNAAGSMGPGDWLKHGSFGQAGPPPPAAPPITPSMPAEGSGDGASIDRTTEGDSSREAGGVHLALAGDNIDVLAGKALAEKIGGAKLTFARTGDIAQTVAGSLHVVVKSDVRRTAGADMSTSAKKTLIVVGAAAQLESDERVELRGDTIELEASDELKLVSGSAELTLQPGKTKMKGQVKLEAPGGKITVTGSPDNLT